MKSCLVLTAESQARILTVATQLSLIPNQGVKIHCHHLTLSFNGPAPTHYKVGDKVKFFLSEYGISDKAIAFFCDAIPGCESGNPHITLLTFEGGKPVDSLEISEYFQFTGIEVEGIFHTGDDCFSLPLATRKNSLFV